MRAFIYQVWEADGKQVATAFTYSEALRLCVNYPSRFIRQLEGQGEYITEIQRIWKDA